MKKQPKSDKAIRENPEWTMEMIAKARPAKEVLPKIFGARTAATMLKPRGRPKSPESKVAISLRLSPDTLAVREPSMDDVFLALTGHKAEVAPEEGAEAAPAPKKRGRR